MEVFCNGYIKVTDSVNWELITVLLLYLFLFELLPLGGKGISPYQLE